MPDHPAVTAHTRVIFMIGSPVAQARSPSLFNAHFAEAGIDRVVVPLEVPRAGVAGFLEVVRHASNCDGVIVTVPLKAGVLEGVDVATERARALGAVNVVRREEDGRLSGDMTDGPGFWAAAEGHGFDPEGKRIVLSGAGAAATAIAHEFVLRGGRAITVTTGVPAEFDQLSGLIAEHGIDIAAGRPTDLSGFDMAINATPVGMDHAPGTPFAKPLLATLPSNALVADAVTEPAETRLLADARSLGLEVMAGEEMTRGQFGLIGEFLGVL
jgi:shikimate dehydrogenase